MTRTAQDLSRTQDRTKRMNGHCDPDDDAFCIRSATTWVPCILLLFVSLFGFCGCQTPFKQTTSTDEVDEGLLIPVVDRDVVWEKAVDVLHAYQFSVVGENHLEGVIETDYKVGASLIEPWHRDSVGFRDRLESTLQSIRRKVCINISPADGGQYVNIEVLKELEDVDGNALNLAGGGTFHDSKPLRRDLQAVVGRSAPSGWIPQGRDQNLERALLESLAGEFKK